jgi:hypothetical protein
MKTKHWIERILVSLTVFCLAVTGLGVQPAQASPPASDYIATEFYLIWRGGDPPFCKNTEHELVNSFTIFDPLATFEEAQLFKAFGDVRLRLSTKFGKSKLFVGCIANAVDCNTPSDGNFSKVRLGWPNYFGIKYTAPDKQVVDELTVEVYDQSGYLIGKKSLIFEVIGCNIAFHGTADMGATANALSPGDTWNFVGTYDVAGMVEMNEGGMANGQGTASMFMDGVAAESQIGCEFTSPIQGNTTVEVKADPEAWAKGSLQLQIHLESMPVSFGGIGCTSFGGKWTTGGVAVTTASFDLDPVLLPANGGTTSLEFQLPDQPGTFKMDLIAVIEEAES